MYRVTRSLKFEAIHFLPLDNRRRQYEETAIKMVVVVCHDFGISVIQVNHPGFDFELAMSVTKSCVRVFIRIFSECYKNLSYFGAVYKASSPKKLYIVCYEYSYKCITTVNRGIIDQEFFTLCYIIDIYCSKMS